MTDGLQDPAPLRDEINEKIGELFEFNQKILQVLRSQAHDFELLGGYFDVQKHRAYDIANKIMELAVMASSNTTNIIIAEFGHDEEIGLIDLMDEDEDEEDDDGH